MKTIEKHHKRIWKKVASLYKSLGSYRIKSIYEISGLKQYWVQKWVPSSELAEGVHDNWIGVSNYYLSIDKAKHLIYSLRYEKLLKMKSDDYGRTIYIP